MQRRQMLACGGGFLAGLLTGFAGGLSIGSGGADSDSETTPTPTPTATPTPTPTDTPTPTPTETPTPTPTETPTPTPTPTETPAPTPTPTPSLPGIAHDVGEQFTVGEGDNAIAYRIIEFYRTTELGDSTSRTTARGTYLVLVVELTNRGNDAISFPRECRILNQKANNWSPFDDEASEFIENDDRIDGPNLGTKIVQPGDSLRGAVAYDVDPDGIVHVMIVPTGDTNEPEHYVRIGAVDSIQQL